MSEDERIYNGYKAIFFATMGGFCAGSLVTHLLFTDPRSEQILSLVLASALFLVFAWAHQPSPAKLKLLYSEWIGGQAGDSDG